MKNSNIMKFSSYSSTRGFTLIEIMIVIGIIGVLTAIAIPTYGQYVIKTNRADGQDKLTEIMYQMERFATRNRTYTQVLGPGGLGFTPQADGTFESNRGEYTLAAAPCAGSTIANCVVVTATPRVGGTQERDGPLTLNSRGNTTGNWQ